MSIGVLYIDFLVHGARSLKDKRRVVKSLKQRIRNRFNCSLAETDFHDQWGRAQLTICVVANESRHANTQLNKIAQFAEQNRDADITNYQIEML